MQSSTQTTRNRGFTLIELIVIIVVLAILSGVAIPKYIDYSERARVTAISANLKMIRRALLNYRMEKGDYPPDQLGGVMPPEMNEYFSSAVWATPIQGVGVYNWEGPPGWAGIEAIGVGSLVSVPSSPLTDPFWQKVDAQIDDGNLSTGFFRWDSGISRYQFRMN